MNLLLVSFYYVPINGCTDVAGCRIEFHPDLLLEFCLADFVRSGRSLRRWTRIQSLNVISYVIEKIINLRQNAVANAP